MKITIEFEGQVVSIYNPDALTLPDALELCQRALLAVGYSFNGDLIVEEQNSDLDS